MKKHPSPRTDKSPSMTSLGVRLDDQARGALLASTSPHPRKPSARTNADDLAVDVLSSAQKARMERDRAQGRGDLADVREYSIERLSQLLAEAVCQGDYIAAANVSAALHNRKARPENVAEHAARAFLRGSRETAAIAADRWQGLSKELSNIIHDHCVVMQSAWIEWRHGDGAESAMAWIHNTLAGPGHIPDANAPYGKEAQAWFDKNRHDPLPPCFCGRPSNILARSQGFCCPEHADQVRTGASQ